MECKDCKMECIGATPCEKCKEKMDIKAILKDVWLLIAAALLFYWIGVIV